MALAALTPQPPGCAQPPPRTPDPGHMFPAVPLQQAEQQLGDVVLMTELQWAQGGKCASQNDRVIAVGEADLQAMDTAEASRGAWLRTRPGPRTPWGWLSPRCVSA